MNTREFRRGIAEDTLKILEKGYFVSPTGKSIHIEKLQEKAETQSKLYSPEESDELLEVISHKERNVPTEIIVCNQTTLDATREAIKNGHTDVLCLNFASARNAGGGFLGGSQAQEESIARSTGLYNCQIKLSGYYDANRKTKSCFYTDFMIYSPNVPILKDEDGNNLEELISSAIITAPAVNAGVVKQREPERISEIEEVMKRRIRKVLAISLENGHTTIVLGAWGCGVFQNNYADVARYFKEIIYGEFKNRFQKIVFAIYSKNEKFIEPFYSEFGKK